MIPKLCCVEHCAATPGYISTQGNIASDDPLMKNESCLLTEKRIFSCKYL